MGTSGQTTPFLASLFVQGSNKIDNKPRFCKEYAAEISQLSQQKEVQDHYLTSHALVVNDAIDNTLFILLSHKLLSH